MINDAIKLFEMLLRQFERSGDIQKGFFKGSIEPLYQVMKAIYGDYQAAYIDMCGIFDDRLPKEPGALKKLILQRAALQSHTRIEAISVAERLPWGRAFKQLSSAQQTAVMEFSEAVQDIFQLEPRRGIQFGGSFYEALIRFKLAEHIGENIDKAKADLEEKCNIPEVCLVNRLRMRLVITPQSC